MNNTDLFAQSIEIIKIINASYESKQEADELIRLISLIMALRQTN